MEAIEDCEGLVEDFCADLNSWCLLECVVSINTFLVSEAYAQASLWKVREGSRSVPNRSIPSPGQALARLDFAAVAALP